MLAVERMPRPAAGAARTAPHELASVQYLRAVAALLVVYFHAVNHYPGIPAPVRRDVGLAGVDLFFAISGFVMVLTTANNRYTVAQFLARRVIRIVPLYWCFTFLMAALLLLVPEAFGRSRFTLEHLARSLLFVPHENPGEAGAITPMVKLGWTLNYEMLFYLLFGLCMGLRPLRRSLVTTALLATVGALCAAIEAPPPPLRFWGNLIVFEFALGMLVGHAYVAGWLRRIPARVATAVLVASVASIVWVVGLGTDVHRLFTFAPSCAALLVAMLALEEAGALPDLRLVRFLGDASYSLYLSHFFAVVALQKGWRLLGLPSGGYAATLTFIGLCLATSGALAGVIFVTLERPMLTSMRTRLLGGHSRRAPRHPASR
jgi:exopolysaccharide production protein ExoZ